MTTPCREGRTARGARHDVPPEALHLLAGQGARERPGRDRVGLGPRYVRLVVPVPPQPRRRPAVPRRGPGRRPSGSAQLHHHRDLRLLRGVDLRRALRHPAGRRDARGPRLRRACRRLTCGTAPEPPADQPGGRLVVSGGSPPGSPPHMWARAALRGAVAGLAGVAVMTAGEELEQRFTHRPDSYVPARTLTA